MRLFGKRKKPPGKEVRKAIRVVEDAGHHVISGEVWNAYQEDKRVAAEKARKPVEENQRLQVTLAENKKLSGDIESLGKANKRLTDEVNRLGPYEGQVESLERQVRGLRGTVSGMYTSEQYNGLRQELVDKTGQYQELDIKLKAQQQRLAVLEGVRRSFTELSQKHEQQERELARLQQMETGLAGKAVIDQTEYSRLLKESNQLPEALGLQGLMDAEISGLYTERGRLLQALETTRQEKTIAINQVVRTLETLEHYIQRRNQSYFTNRRIKGLSVVVADTGFDSLIAAARFSRARYSVVFTLRENWPQAIAAIQGAEEIVLLSPPDYIFGDKNVAAFINLLQSSGTKISAIGNKKINGAEGVELVYSPNQPVVGLAHRYITGSQDTHVTDDLYMLFSGQNGGKRLKSAISLYHDPEFFDRVAYQLGAFGMIKNPDDAAEINARSQVSEILMREYVGMIVNLLSQKTGKI